MNVVYYGKEYNNLSRDTIAGIFLGSNVDRNDFLPVLENLGNGNFKIIQEFTPSSKFLQIKTNYQETKFNSDPLTSLYTNFPDLYQISNFYKIMVFIPLKTERSINVVMTNSMEIVNGLVHYFSVKDNNPEPIWILKESEKKWKATTISKSFINNGKKDNILTQIVHINFHLPNKLKKIKFDSLDPNGWKRNDLFDLISEKYIEFSKKMGYEVNSKIYCIKITDIGNNTYDPFFETKK